MKRGANRGVALIQALVIAAALAGVAAALMLRTGAAVERGQAHNRGAQLALALDAGQVLLQQVISDLPPGPLPPDPGWTQRAGVEQGTATLAWQVTELSGHLDLTRIAQGAPGPLEQARAAAQEIGLSAAQTDALFSTAQAALIPGAAQAVSLAQIAALLPADLPPLPERSAQVFAVLDGAQTVNINAADEPVLRAMMPDLSEAALADLLDTRRARPFETPEELERWAEQTQSADDAEQIVLAEWGTQATWFAFRLTARLDSHSLRRSGVIHRTAAPVAARLVFAIPEP